MYLCNCITFVYPTGGKRSFKLSTLKEAKTSMMRLIMRLGAPVSDLIQKPRQEMTPSMMRGIIWVMMTKEDCLLN